MENTRTLLLVALAMLGMMLWEAWNVDYGPKPVAETATEAATHKASETKTDPGTPTTPQEANAGSSNTLSDMLASGKTIDVKTDVLHLEIDTKGGVIRAADLVKYSVSLDEPNNAFHLISDIPEKYFVAQTGLLGAKTNTSAVPDHNAIFVAAQENYVLKQGEEKLEVAMTWQSPEGVSVRKIYTFYPGKYLIDSRYEVQNNSSAELAIYPYSQYQRVFQKAESKFINTYTGGVIHSDEDKYKKITFAKMDDENLKKEVQGGWVAMIQHYFLSAWVPNKDDKNQFYSSVRTSELGKLYTLGMVSSAKILIPPGAKQTTETKLYIGPKLQTNLKQIAPGLELTVDYGVLDIIARPIYWLMEKIHSFVGNWGWTIILLTILIKLTFFKLSETSYKSMANMRKLTPRMTQLKERFGDDRQGLNQAMMEMYKKEKINPLGGCLPILVQIPVFISLYWVLLESVEMRQAPFILWIHDLSAMDPYYVLPVIMGISMVIQQKLNPAPIDPIQQKIMMVLPLVFTVFFVFFPSGLVLYWVVNNMLSITQQWVITKRIAG